jgi:hypothetical protein
MSTPTGGEGASTSRAFCCSRVRADGDEEEVVVEEDGRGPRSLAERRMRAAAAAAWLVWVVAVEDGEGSHDILALFAGGGGGGSEHPRDGLGRAAGGLGSVLGMWVMSSSDCCSCVLGAL